VRKPARLPLEALEPYLLDLASGGRESPGMTDNQGAHAPRSPEPLDWSAVFGNDLPIEIEVGFGKGLYLVTAGQAHPDTNYLGIEVLRALQLYAATRLAKRSLTNVRVACTDARRFLHDRVPPGSVQAVHVYFPDPWWKKRHHKRRVWTPTFAADCVSVLRPGGRLHAATDVQDYFAHIRELLDGQTGLRRLWAEEQTGPPRPDEILTNFERKAREKGGSVFRAEYERPG
jgi:tRNA (guanine-N7-)-methyltransferase